jgi:hypothetical protein
MLYKFPRSIPKEFFQNLPNSIPLSKLKNLYYLKMIKFIVFSDVLSSNHYDEIASFFEKISFNKDTLVNIGTKTPPFGVLFSDFSDIKALNELFNSAQFCLHFEDSLLTKRNIVANIITGTLPLISFNAWFLKPMGLQDFYCENLIEKFNDFNKNYPFWITRVCRLSSKYENRF